MQFLELYLHLINKIPIGKIIKHDWFKKPTPEQKKEPLIKRKLPLIFEKKQQIYDLIYKIEEERTSLMYDKPKKEQTKNLLNNFLKLKNIFAELLKNEIEI